MRTKLRIRVYASSLILVVASFPLGMWAAKAEELSKKDLPKITVRNSMYVVRDEDDGAGGNGVDLYVGYLVIGEKNSFGGTSNVAGGLKNNNGSAKAKTNHPRNDELFSIEIPTDTAVLVKLNLIESDQTTDRIKKTYAEAKLPVFGDGAFKGNFQVSVGTGIKPVVDALATTVNLLNNLLHGRAIDTDDDYGNWSILFINDGGHIKTQITSRGANCSEKLPKADITLDGKWHDLGVLTFKDKDNDIDVVLDIMPK